MNRALLLTTLALWFSFSFGRAQSTYTGAITADAFLTTGSPDNPDGADLTGLNFGGAGTLVVAPASSDKGEFQSIIRFNTADAANSFNTTYGTNGWKITNISLELTSNYGTAGVQPNNPIFNFISGGNFVIEWLSNDDWLEGTGNPNLPTTDGVTFDSLPDLLASPHEILCTNTYSPPGNNVHATYPLPLNPDLVTNITSGADVSLLLYAADANINFLFNSQTYGRGNEPLFHITAAPSLEIVSACIPNGAFHLTGIGAQNTQYHVLANSDLTTTNWQIIGTVTADDVGSIEFDDTNFTAHAQQFYRLSN